MVGHVANIIALGVNPLLPRGRGRWGPGKGDEGVTEYQPVYKERMALTMATPLANALPTLPCWRCSLLFQVLDLIPFSSGDIGRPFPIPRTGRRPRSRATPGMKTPLALSP